MKLNELLEGIKEVYGKYFPNSLCVAQYNDNLYSSIWIKCCIGKEKDEFANGIVNNDILNISFLIDENENGLPKDLTLDSEIPNDLCLKNESNSFLTKPENRYMCYSHKSIRFRKTKGDGEKIIKSLDKFFSNLHDELINELNNNNIHDNHIELLKKKLNI